MQYGEAPGKTRGQKINPQNRKRKRISDSTSSDCSFLISSSSRFPRCSSSSSGSSSAASPAQTEHNQWARQQHTETDTVAAATERSAEPRHQVTHGHTWKSHTILLAKSKQELAHWTSTLRRPNRSSCTPPLRYPAVTITGLVSPSRSHTLWVTICGCSAVALTLSA